MRPVCNASLLLALSASFALATPLVPAVAQTPQRSARAPHKTVPLESLESVLGIYSDRTDPDSKLSIMHDGGQLTMESARMPRVELRAEFRDHFSTQQGSQVEFQRDADGNVITMTIAGGRRSADSIVTYVRTSRTPEKLNHFRAYSRAEYMVPVRDGVKLHIVVLRPEGSETSGEPLPILMVRTPYGVDGASSMSVNGSKPEMAASGYIFVYGDIRGRYKSEGQFVMNRPIVHVAGNRTDPALVDESSDTYDTVEWMLKNLPNNNGKVGFIGVSYPGFTAIMAAIDHHPAVKAVSPQAPMTDIWLGDDFFHNGAFRQTYGFDYAQQLEAQKTDKRVSMTEDTYNYFLRYGNFAEAAKAAKIENLPTPKHFIAEPAYTKFWQDMSVLPHLTSVEVPTLEVGGWFDQEDMYGTQAEYAALQKEEKPGGPSVYMVLGPWNHGGWASGSHKLGALDFGSATGDDYRKRYEFPFFEKFLKDRDGFNLADTASFRTGENQWHTYEVWPPKAGFHKANLYLAPKLGISFDAPRGNDQRSRSSYVADPSNPIPYRERPIQSTYGEGSKWRPWLSSSQSFLKGRKDLLSFTTQPLEQQQTITGDIVADIFASTTGSDADWIVKLIDVYPDDATDGMAGYQAMVVDEIFRGRYRTSFEKAAPIEPNKVTEFKWSLHGADHTFLKGHRIMVQVQSSWFPLYDRNPQTFVPNIMTAPEEAYKAETQSIFFSKSHPSHLEVLVPDSEGSGSGK